jgi:chaperonin cofactor prefoldin
MTSSYQKRAEISLRVLAQLKQQQRALETEIKDVQAELTQYVLAGDLEHLKTDASNTYNFEDINFVYSTGRVSYDYSTCPEVTSVAEALKELQSTAVAIGMAKQKVGTPFWTVRA